MRIHTCLENGRTRPSISVKLSMCRLGYSPSSHGASHAAHASSRATKGTPASESRLGRPAPESADGARPKALRNMLMGMGGVKDEASEAQSQAEGKYRMARVSVPMPSGGRATRQTSTQYWHRSAGGRMTWLMEGAWRSLSDYESTRS